MKRTELERKKEMYHILTQWDKSGMNQKEFCVAHGINYSVFKYWNKKRKIEHQSRTLQSKPQKKRSVKTNTEGFIPITLHQKLKSAGLHITYPNGVEVACPVEIELEQFKLIIQIY